MMQKQMDERTLGRKALVIVWPTLEDSRFIERNKSLYKRSLIRAFRVPEKHLSPRYAWAYRQVLSPDLSAARGGINIKPIKSAVENTRCKPLVSPSRAASGGWVIIWGSAEL